MFIMSYHTSGILFKNSFGTEEMRDIFSEAQYIQTFLTVEAALARSEARAGLIPDEIAEEISEKASLEFIDFERVEANVEESGLFTVAIIDAWRENFNEAGEYIHWGATSQDISDTAFMLQIRDGLDIVQRDLEEIMSTLIDLAREHRSTPMIGRTHFVQAIPITFGLKVATWFDEISRHIDRLEQLRERLFVVEFFGAAGTLASLGEDGLEVQKYLADELDLNIPAVAWHASRDRLAELMSVFAMIAGTISKIASQILLLNRPEIDEINEPPEGTVGSSTMPHKRNPVRSQIIVALGRLIRSHTDTMFDLLDGYDERDYSTWLPEFAVLNETFLYQSRLLKTACEILNGLVVNTEKMRSNLNLFGDLVASERVMMALADYIGRQTAYEIVQQNSTKALDGEKPFQEYLLSDDRITSHLTEAEIKRLITPEEYTGVAALLVDRALDSHQ